MKTIELRPKPLRHITRTFFSLFITFLLGKLWRYGMFEESEAWLFFQARVIEAFVGTAIFCLVLAIPFSRGRFDIRLTETTLQTPLTFWKSITVNLSDLSVNRLPQNPSFRDRLFGTQVVTKDGQPLRIFSSYPSKSIPNLLDEIERRQELINNPNQPSEVNRRRKT
ncbi:hypothetical protein P4B35_15005 [Pontiellaceae bacterium B12227]|nr:hypothetical protein [Pontiellaceae bacterium B12227]